jgi:hypothetical protein
MNNYSVLRRRLLARYALTFLAIAIPLILIISYQLQAERVTALAYAKSNARNLTNTLEAKIKAEFEDAETAVTLLAKQANPSIFQPKDSRNQRPEIVQLLKSIAPFVSTSSALRMFASDGALLYSSNDNETSLNIGDRTFFKKAQDDVSGEPIFSEVVVGRLTHRVTMYVVKPIRNTDGAFLGLAMAAIDLNTLHDYFKDIALGKDGAIALRRLDDGAVVVRYPGPVEVDNKPNPNLPTRLAVLDRESNGILELLSPVDNVQRIYGIQQIDKYPLYIAVGLAEMDYLSDWHQHKYVLVAATSILLVILAFVLYLLAHSQWRREKSEQALGKH